MYNTCHWRLYRLLYRLRLEYQCFGLVNESWIYDGKESDTSGEHKAHDNNSGWIGGPSAQLAGGCPKMVDVV